MKNYNIHVISDRYSKNQCYTVLLFAVIFFISNINTNASNYYWVGNGGNWSDTSHWATSSGGSSHYSVPPTASDNVYLDSASFISNNQTVNIDEEVDCNNMDWTGITHNVWLWGDYNLFNIYGSLTLSPLITYFDVDVYFLSTNTGNTITMAGVSTTYDFYFMGIGGNWTFQDAVTVLDIILEAGTLNTNNKTVTCLVGFMVDGALSKTLNLGASTINLEFIYTGEWGIYGSNLTLNAGTSQINCNPLASSSPKFYGGGKTYYDLNFLGSKNGMLYDNNTFHNVSFAANGYINGSNNFNNVSFASNGSISGSNTFNKLSLSAGNTYNLTHGTTQTISDSLVANGSCTSSILIQSNSLGSTASISKSSGNITINYCTLKAITATGGATFTANNSVDGGYSTSGWTINTPSPVISYASSPFCKSLSSGQSVTVTGQSGGTYSSTSGLSINGSTGAITPSSSTAGTYSVSYTASSSGMCPSGTTATTVTVTAVPVATFSYPDSAYCNNAPNILPSFSSGEVAGIFSAVPSGLHFVSTSTGEINIDSSTANTYTVTNTIAASAGCATVTASYNLTIHALPTAIISSTTNVSCHGGNNGSLTVRATGGPFTYSWSSGGTDSIAGNLPAGNDTVTVTDTIGCLSKIIGTVTQPPLLTSSLTDSMCHGYNICIYGDSTGLITETASGGVPPYSYLWSNGATTSSIHKLIAGSYSVIITDSNGCTKADTILLTQAPQLVVDSLSSPLNSSGYNLTCHGNTNGVIHVYVSGGVPYPPTVGSYTYSWRNDKNTFFTGNPDINTAPAGSYTVQITDANNATVTATITLTEPDTLLPVIKRSFYPNGYNVDSIGGTDGGMRANVTGGIIQYSYIWSWDAGEAALTQIGTGDSVGNLQAGHYYLHVTDANGCYVNVEKWLYQPSAWNGGWGMAGDTLTDPAYNFIGTTDSVDFAIRTNNIEHLRVKANGDIAISSLSGTDNRSLYVDINGVIKVVPHEPPPIYLPCTLPNSWYFGDNFNDIVRCSGNVGIGTTAPSQKLEIQHNDNKGGIALNRINGIIKNSEIKFNWNGVEQWAIGNDFDGNGHSTFFIWDENHHNVPFYINEEGKVGIGGGQIPPTNRSNSIYRLYVDGGIAARDVIVQATGWPDFVFNRSYVPLTLSDLDKYIKKNGHLPDMPTEEELQKGVGIELGAMQSKLLMKIEELTLYILEQQKQIDELKESKH